jgi:hypothetical protein
MNILMGLALAVFGAVFVISSRPFSRKSVANQEKMSGPMSERSRRVLGQYSRVGFIVVGSVMVLIGLGVAAGLVS